MASIPVRTIEGTGFGLGGFGGIDESFGSVGSDFVVIREPVTILRPKPRKGAVILGSKDAVYETRSGVVALARTSHIDSSGITSVSNRKLIFEGS